ncbi:MAG TPA: head-tail connector protein [Massilibacterium sp.]|nr:head-tail connector protein [Massilibacterium sp.]
MIESVKGALRVTSNDPLIIEDINDLIESARMDLIISGVSEEKAKNDNDPLIKRAIIIYAKANYGLDNPNADRFQDSYNMLKQHLSLAGDYNGKLE